MKLTSKMLNKMIKEAIEEVGERPGEFIPREFNGVADYYDNRFGGAKPTTTGGKPMTQVQNGGAKPTTTGGKPMTQVQNGGAKPTTTGGKPMTQVQDGLKGAASGGQNPASVPMPDKLPETKQEAYRAIAGFGNGGWLQKAQAAGWSQEMIQRCRDIFNGKYVAGQGSGPKPMKEPVPPRSTEEGERLLKQVHALGYKTPQEAAQKNGWPVEIANIITYYTDPSYSEPLDSDAASGGNVQPATGTANSGLGADDDSTPMSNGMGGYYVGDDPDAQLPSAPRAAAGGVQVGPAPAAPKVSLSETQLRRVVLEATMNTLREMLK